MMTRSPDILFTAEYIKNVLYFATVRTGKTLKSNSETHYFSIDDELVYENYYADFGPLNLGCVYKYCKLLNDKIKLYLNKQTIVHYTTIDHKKKTNAAFLLGCYGVLCLSLPPRDALKPLLVHGQSYRPFQDATQGDAVYTITLMDCMHAIKKAADLRLFNFQDFNYEEYSRLDNIQGGDLNWILPGKILAFIGPVDYIVSYHPPEMYINYFLECNVKIVIRLNKRLYDGNVFNNAGIVHYDLFFPDGSCPPRHILLKFLQICEECDGALAVHCKAGLGRTGSLIGCYLIKHYRMTAREAIAWMRICRPGCVIGHQQDWLEKLESWLLKQGNIYRKRTFNDTERFPVHEFGIYSIAEHAIRQRPSVHHKSPSPPPPAPVSRQPRADASSPTRPQPSKSREGAYKTEKDLHDWRVRTSKLSVHKAPHKGEQYEENTTARRGSGAGEPRPTRPLSRTSTVHTLSQRNSAKSNESSTKTIKSSFQPTITTFRPSNGPSIKNISDARKYLTKSSVYDAERAKQQQLSSSITVTPHYSTAAPRYDSPTSKYMAYVAPSSFNTASRTTQPQYRRRLGRSPSPPQARMPSEQTRATNTPSSQIVPPVRAMVQKFVVRDASKSRLKDALSRMKLASPRDGSVGKASVGAASLGARRDAPLPKQAPSVRSDERPLATQGDMLNSIKFQRRFARDFQHSDKITSVINMNKSSPSSHKEKSTEMALQREKSANTASRNFFRPARPTSPNVRRSQHSPSFY